MSEHDNVTSGGEQSQPSSGARRRFLTGLVTGGLLGSLLAGGASMYVQAHPSPGSWFGGRHGPLDPGKAGERAGIATDWVLHRIDASAEQCQQVHGS